MISGEWQNKLEQARKITYCNHFFNPLNTIFSHFHDVFAQSVTVWDMEWLAASVSILEEIAEARVLDDIKWLIRRSHPLGE